MEEGIWCGEIINWCKDGRLIDEWLIILVVCDEQGKLLNYVGVFEDIFEECWCDSLICCLLQVVE